MSYEPVAFKPSAKPESVPLHADMTPMQIREAFTKYCELNGVTKKSIQKNFRKMDYTAQYWFLAGVRACTKDGKLPPAIEVFHACGRSIITQ